MIKNLFYAGLISLISLSANAQCTDWVSPTATDPWTDFDPMPCNGESQEITVFESYQSEAYLLEEAMMGGNYTYSTCNGPGAGTWVPEFTVIAPSGAVDAFGAGDGDGCSITWTATESGDYIVVINEAGNCGIAGTDDNGYPMITTNSGGADCSPPPVFIDGAQSFEADTVNLPECWQAIDADGDGFNWNIVTAPAYTAFDGTTSVASFSYDEDEGTALTPDNYLITPQLDIVDGDSLYYIVKSVFALFAAENYSVLVSTTGSAVADFQDEVFTEVLASADYEGRSVDLSAYDGQSIYIAFRHHDVSDESAMQIDAIFLPGVNCTPDAVNNLETVESKLFPNPATDKLNITSPLQGAATVSIFDALGRVVLQKNVTLSQATYTQSISALENGVYTIQISTADKIASERFVKQ